MNTAFNLELKVLRCVCYEIIMAVLKTAMTAPIRVNENNLSTFVCYYTYASQSH